MDNRLASPRRALLIGTALLIVQSIALAQRPLGDYLVFEEATGPVAKITETEFTDVDGDGDIDVVLWAPDALRIYKKEGMQPFAAVASPATAPGTVFRGARTGDVDGDGDPDLVVCAETPGGLGFVEVFMNDGSAAFSSAGRLSVGASESWSHPTFGDIDGNGELDLVVYEDGAQNYMVFWDVHSPSPPSPSAIAAGSPDRAAQLHDFDGDGDLDILFGSTAAGIFWTETLAVTRAFGTPRSLGLAGRGRAAGDVDGDGDLEIIAAVSGGPVYFDNLGAGQFGPFQRIVNSSVNPLGDCRCVDVDLDGNLDVVFFVGTGSMVIAPGDGTGSFGAVSGSGSPTSGLSVEFQDRDGDGDMDAFSSSEDQTAPSAQGSLYEIENVALPLAGGPCSAAVALVPSQTAYVDPLTAVPGGPPWPCASSTLDSWYSYTVPPGSDSFTAVATTRLSNPPAPVAIYEGMCGSPVPLACEIATPSQISNTVARADGLIPLQTYLIRVGVDPSNTSALLLSVYDNGGPPTSCLSGGNASFESGDLSGWTFSDIAGAFIPIEVSAAGANPGFGLFSTNPTSGHFTLRTGFDGDGPGTISLSQEIHVTSAVQRLTFNYRAGWSILNPSAVEDRTFAVVVRDAGGTMLQSDLFLTAGAQTTVLDTGSRVASVDLSSYLGQTVELSFEWHVPESNTGPAHFQLDNITCPGAEEADVGDRYCFAVFNSTGFRARITASGSRSTMDNNLTLTASEVPPGQFGLFVVATALEIVPGANGASTGNLCVGGSIGRFNVIQTADGAGRYSMPVDLREIPQGLGTVPVIPGQSWFFQSWYRDPQIGLGSNFTDGVRVLFN